MTNGIVSIVDEQSHVLIKVVAGCDGTNADALVNAIAEAYPQGTLIDSNEIYKLAIKIGFGCVDCLVLQDQNRFIYRGEDALSELMELQYRAAFDNAALNPRTDPPRYAQGDCLSILYRYPLLHIGRDEYGKVVLSGQMTQEEANWLKSNSEIAQ